MKLFILGLLLISNTLLASPEGYKAEFPLGPDTELTPGSLCDRPNSYRYPERIAYCNREALEPGIKEDVFREYRHSGYRLNLKNRSDYKIDHLIPLCAGGSNRENNLWPQHVTIFEVTDPLESLGCEKLRGAKIKQARLVQLILAAKKNLSLVPQTLRYLQSL